jgi:ABC-2 type transport system permease protein
MNAIYILWLRQLKRYCRSRARLLGSLGQPLLFLVALGFGFGPIYQKAGEGNYLQFIGPGIIAMSITFMAIFSGIEIIWDRQFGFLRETFVAPVSRFKIMFGRTLGGATVAVIQGLLVFVITFFIGFRPINLHLLLPAFLFMILIAFFFTALGTAIASLMKDMQAFPVIMNFIVMPMFFLSGAIFPLKGLPEAIVIATRINPLSYGVDGLRATLTNQVFFSLGLDFLVLIAADLLLLAIGSYLFSKIEM